MWRGEVFAISDCLVEYGDTCFIKTSHSFVLGECIVFFYFYFVLLLLSQCAFRPCAFRRHTSKIDKSLFVSESISVTSCGS